MGMAEASPTTSQEDFKMTRLVTVLLVASMLLFSAPDENKAAKIRRTVQGLKATVAQLQDQIIVLESQFASGAEIPSAPKVAAVPSVAATPERPSQRLVQQAPTVVESVRQQCAATTKRGARCSRMAATGKTTCWQH